MVLALGIPKLCRKKPTLLLRCLSEPVEGVVRDAARAAGFCSRGAAEASADAVCYK